MKLVVNRCYGGFGLSKKAVERMAELGHDEAREELDRDNFYGFVCADDEQRADQILVQVVEELGREADGSCAALEIVEIPDGIDFQIDEYDGLEWVAEKHQTW